MLKNKIVKSLLFKLSSVVSQVISLVLVLRAFDKDVAAVWLVLQSLIQLGIPFIGFGVTHALIKRGSLYSYLSAVNSGRFILYILVIVGASFSLDNTQLFSGSLIIYALHMAVITSVAELLRARSNLHLGFFLYNGYLLFCAVGFNYYDPGDFFFQIFMSTVCAIFCSFCLVKERLHFREADFYRDDGLKVTIQDFWRSVAFLICTQYYSLAVWFGSYFFSAEAFLPLIVIYRFQILLNWPNFFWSRFAHSELAVMSKVSFWTQHRKIFWPYAAFSLCVAIMAVFTTFFYPMLANEYSLDSMLLVCFIGLRILINYIPPFELFSIYQKHDSDYLWWLIMVLLITVVLFLIGSSFGYALGYVVAVECGALVVRITSRRFARGA